MAKRKRPHAAEPETRPSRSVQVRRALAGFASGFVFWIAASNFLMGLVPHVAEDWTFVLAGLLGAVIAVTRYRPLLWAAYGVLVISFVVFGYTPVVPWMVHGWVRQDALRHAQAAVVLGADGDGGVEITQAGQSRLLHGYEVTKEHYAPELVVSRGASEVSWIPAVKKQMDLLGIDVPLIETKYVTNTHDEALAVAEIARARRWNEVILITHPLHMRRAVGVFEKAGVHVIASPCQDFRYNLDDLNNMPSRVTALREWLHEVIGCWVYRRRGWMD